MRQPLRRQRRRFGLCLGRMADGGLNPRGNDVGLRSGPQMREYEAIATRIAADRPSRILDWGAGLGQMTALLSEHGIDVTAFDYDPDRGGSAAIEPLPAYPDFRVRLSDDPRRLPFGDREFDAVLSCGVLEHVEDPDASLEEIKRVLVPGGTLYVYKLPNRRSYLEAIAKRVGLYYHGISEHDRLYDVRSTRALLQRHGFDIQELRLANMLPLTITSGLAARASRQIWSVNRTLSAIPGVNLIATNVEAIARTPSHAAGSPA